MKLLKNISRTRLVIVVTHNHELGIKYGDVILNLEGGKLIESK